jgi:hypothetical protein
MFLCLCEVFYNEDESHAEQLLHATGHASLAMMLSVPTLPQRLSFGRSFTQLQSLLLPFFLTFHAQVKVDESTHGVAEGVGTGHAPMQTDTTAVAPPMLFTVTLAVFPEPSKFGMVHVFPALSLATSSDSPHVVPSPPRITTVTWFPPSTAPELMPDFRLKFTQWSVGESALSLTRTMLWFESEQSAMPLKTPTQLGLFVASKVTLLSLCHPSCQLMAALKHMIGPSFWAQECPCKKQCVHENW